MKKTAFDPLSELQSPRASRSWLWATALQALVTCGLLALAKYGEGRAWDVHSRLIVMIGIVATWSLALRTIRARLVELVIAWSRLSKGILGKARERGAQGLPQRLKAFQENYVAASMWRLRIIAAGLTLPFFFLSAFLAALCFSQCVHRGDTQLLGLGLFSATCAVIVGWYFHWACLPPPEPAAARPRRPVQARARRKV